jgi:hypothetical protein
MQSELLRLAEEARAARERLQALLRLLAELRGQLENVSERRVA